MPMRRLERIHDQPENAEARKVPRNTRRQSDAQKRSRPKPLKTSTKANQLLPLRRGLDQEQNEEKRLHGKAQSTLTQIDWVKLQQMRMFPEADLEYIEDGTGGDPENTSGRWSAMEAAESQKQQRSRGRDRKRALKGPRGRRASSSGMENKEATGNTSKKKNRLRREETLTQMGWVSSFAEDKPHEDEGQLSYEPQEDDPAINESVQSRPKNLDQATVSKASVEESDLGENEDQGDFQTPTPKRRRVERAIAESQSASQSPTANHDQDLPVTNLPPVFKTPEKPRRLEIPSSQSPEGSEIIFQSGSFTSSSRSQRSHQRSRKVSHYASSRSDEQPVDITSPSPTPKFRKPNMIPETSLSSASSLYTPMHLFSQGSPLSTPPSRLPPADGRPENDTPRPQAQQKDEKSPALMERETQAYTLRPFQTPAKVVQNSVDDTEDSILDPDTPTHSETAYRKPVDGNSNAHSLALEPEPSALYHRQPLTLALEPLSSDLAEINSQRMANLFPPSLHIEPTDVPLPAPGDKDRGSLGTQSQMPLNQADISTESATMSPPIHAHRNGISSETQNQIPIDQADISTESATLSSQVPRTPTLAKNKFPSSPPPFLLIESSQARDHERLTGNAEAAHGSPQMLTASQILSNSLMETIPSPPIPMSSQDLIEENQ